MEDRQAPAHTKQMTEQLTHTQNHGRMKSHAQLTVGLEGSIWVKCASAGFTVNNNHQVRHALCQTARGSLGVN